MSKYSKSQLMPPLIIGEQYPRLINLRYKKDFNYQCIPCNWFYYSNEVQTLPFANFRKGTKTRKNLGSKASQVEITSRDMNLFIPFDKKQQRKKQTRISKEQESLHLDQV